MNVSMYDAQADTISVDDISRNSYNRIILRRLQRNDADDYIPTLHITDYDDDDEDEEDYYDYCPEEAYDMGWLGYFVGKNNHLEELVIWTSETSEHPWTSETSVRDVVEPFFRGVCNNKSIQTISFSGMDLLGGDMFTMLGSFFKNNHNLVNIYITHCDFGDEGARLFALALGKCSTHKSLKKVVLEYNDIGEEGMIGIITALSMHPELQELDLQNHLRKNGCVALATLLQSATELQSLFISRNEINDEGIEALIPALATCNHLRKLYLLNNPSITTRGWQRLASILESPTSNLAGLGVTDSNIDDDTLAVFANALVNNRTLHTLNMSRNPSITSVGWQTFSNVLCNTSSVNATSLSNHTLSSLGDKVSENAIIGPLLDLNQRDDKKEVAMIKILQCHNDFDMLPFFEWEFKVLPLVLGWLERASECEMPKNFEPNVEPRKLSAIYQFVRGMPVLYVETHLRKELEDIRVEQSQMEVEELTLDQESEERKQYLQERKALLEERKKNIIRKIGKPNLN